jgi:hypothetical protein
MRTAIHLASAHDLGTVASILADVRDAPDSGDALFRHAVPSGTDLPAFRRPLVRGHPAASTAPAIQARARGPVPGAPG